MKRREFVYVFFGTIVIPATLASSFIWLLLQPAVKPNKEDSTSQVQPVTYKSSSGDNKSSGGWGRRALGLPF